MTSGFVRRTLRAKLCDLIITFPAVHEFVQNSNPFYTSSYVLMTLEKKKITVEIDSLNQLKKILGLKFNIVLFDNMNLKNLKYLLIVIIKYYHILILIIILVFHIPKKIFIGYY